MAKAVQQFTVIAEKTANKNRQAEHVLPVGYREENVFRQGGAELHHFLGVAAGAKPTPPTAERQQIFVVTIGTADTGETLFQVAAGVIVADDVGNEVSVSFFL